MIEDNSYLRQSRKVTSHGAQPAKDSLELSRIRINDDDNDDCATLQLTRASALSSECTLTLFAHDDDDLIVMWKKLIEMILIAITYEW